ncbi:MAG: type II secretion system F family protein [Acidobacteriota bacterium]
MTPAVMLFTFFMFTLMAVSAAGYVLVLKPSRAEGDTADTGGAAPVRVLNQPDLPAPQAAVLDIFRMLGDAIPQNSAQRKSARKLLLLAGFRWPSAVSTFLGIKCATAVTFGVAGAWASLTFNAGVGTSLASLCGLGFGFLLPDRVLERLARARGERLRRGLPAALDLLVLAVEAGQSIDTAILETSRGLRIAHPDLAAEFSQLHLELRAEASRIDALRNFQARTQDAELRKFTALLMDTDRFGSSLGPALRGHAHYLRTRFRQSAQERARKVAVKLIFPVFFLIFPSVILVTLGPAVMLLFQQMENLLGQ